MSAERRRDLGADAVGQAGLHAAGLVVEQMLALSRQLTSARLPLSTFEGDDAESHAGGPATNGSRPTSRQELRRLRADAERLIELYGDWTRTLLDGMSDLVESADGGPEVLEIGPLGPGESSTTTVWVELLGGPPTDPATLHVSDLVAHDRSRIPVDAVTFDPPTIEVDGEESAAPIAVRVQVPIGAPPGRYHGFVLAVGLPEVLLPCAVEVR